MPEKRGEIGEAAVRRYENNSASRPPGLPRRPFLLASGAFASAPPHARQKECRMPKSYPVALFGRYPLA